MSPAILTPAQESPCPLPSPPLTLPHAYIPPFKWGEHNSATIMQSLDEAYSEVVHWQNNILKVPFGNAGKGFVAELSRLYRAYADGSALEAIGLKVCTVMSVLLLQRPFRSSKGMNHSVCLEKRMLTWQKGNIRNLLEEGRALQSHLPKSYPSDRTNPNNLARTFSKLMFQSKTNAALQLLSQQGMGGGIFRADDVVDLGENTQKTVMDIFRSKHPPAQPSLA